MHEDILPRQVQVGDMGFDPDHGAEWVFGGLRYTVHRSERAAGIIPESQRGRAVHRPDMAPDARENAFKLFYDLVFLFLLRLNYHK